MVCDTYDAYYACREFELRTASSQRPGTKPTDVRSLKPKEDPFLPGLLGAGNADDFSHSHRKTQVAHLPRGTVTASDPRAHVARKTITAQLLDMSRKKRKTLPKSEVQKMLFSVGLHTLTCRQPRTDPQLTLPVCMLAGQRSGLNLPDGTTLDQVVEELSKKKTAKTTLPGQVSMKMNSRHGSMKGPSMVSLVVAEDLELPKSSLSRASTAVPSSMGSRGGLGTRGGLGSRAATASTSFPELPRGSATPFTPSFGKLFGKHRGSRSTPSGTDAFCLAHERASTLADSGDARQSLNSRSALRAGRTRETPGTRGNWTTTDGNGTAGHATWSTALQIPVPRDHNVELARPSTSSSFASDAHSFRDVGISARSESNDSFISRVTSESSISDSDKSDSVRVSELFANAGFFKDLDPGLQEQLAQVATFLDIAADTVVFRQGDPPVNCYIVSKGEVGVFVLQGDEDQTPRRHKRCPVLEGWSTYNPRESRYGKKVAAMTPGSTFGELALQNNHKRAASLKCMTACELLVVQRSDFDSVCKSHMLRQGGSKMAFLMRTVPGLLDVPAPLPGGKPHDSYFFQKERFPLGHVFNTQGDTADFAVYAIYRGAVDFFRTETGGHRLFLAREERKLDAVLSRTKEKAWATLEDGDFFGSLPFPYEEPFTVVVASQYCDVYTIPQEVLPQVNKKLLEVLKESIVAQSAMRLKQHSVVQLVDERGHVK